MTKRTAKKTKKKAKTAKKRTRGRPCNAETRAKRVLEKVTEKAKIKAERKAPENVIDFPDNADDLSPREIVIKMLRGDDANGSSMVLRAEKILEMVKTESGIALEKGLKMLADLESEFLIHEDIDEVVGFDVTSTVDMSKYRKIE